MRAGWRAWSCVSRGHLDVPSARTTRTRTNDQGRAAIPCSGLPHPRQAPCTYRVARAHRMTSGAVQEESANLLKVLIDNNRVECVPEIAAEYEQEYNERSETKARRSIRCFDR